jgi:pyridoxine 4-dehydrogenase
LENLASGDITLSAEELQEINNVISGHEVKGDRAFGLSDEQSNLWG